MIKILQLILTWLLIINQKRFILKGKVLRTTEHRVDLKIKSLTAMILPKWKVTRFMFIRLKLSETTRGIVGIIMAKEYGSMKTTRWQKRKVKQAASVKLKTEMLLFTINQKILLEPWQVRHIQTKSIILRNKQN